MTTELFPEQAADKAWDRIGGPTLCEGCYKHGYETGEANAALTSGALFTALPQHPESWRIGYRHGHPDSTEAANSDIEWPGDNTEWPQGKPPGLLILKAEDGQTLKEVWETFKNEMGIR